MDAGALGDLLLDGREPLQPRVVLTVARQIVLDHTPSGPSTPCTSPSRRPR
ncbi:hypothetical protein [Pseudonocardia nigra]|uniref:hypothetical protein n=1 Tax=Pseudonocardia nigra TaxID=1921578 RepID=UPI001C5E9516|nr:hypothetical protein [Pseudonocardia nigra]